MDESRGGSRIVYPRLAPALTKSDLADQFRLAPEEKVWAGTAARRGPSMVVLLAGLPPRRPHRRLDRGEPLEGQGPDAGVRSLLVCPRQARSIPAKTV
jgi:hypothetical protein